MKIRKILILAVFTVSFFGVYKTVMAFGYSSTANFGGRITTTSTPPIICNSQYGIVTVTKASGSAKSGPFVIQSTTKNVSQNAQILGQYEKTVDMKTCYIQAGPYRISVPTYKIKTNSFNTSRR